MLAFGTMPVAAGMVTVTGFATGSTTIDLSSQNFGTATLDGTHGLTVGRQQLVGMFLAVSGAVASKDLRQF